jgi:hypothetical protein
LKDATAVRTKEHDEFAANEKELVETVDTLDRAISIISTEMQKKIRRQQRVILPQPSKS